MAEINNSETGPERVAVRIDILQKVNGSGFVLHGPVLMNAALGVLRANASFEVGTQTFFARQVLLHHTSIKEWASAVEALAKEENKDRDEVHFSAESPELMMTVRRYESPTSEQAFYDLLVVVDSGVMEGASMITGEGPAVYISPTIEAILQFARDLRRGADNVL